jgi:Fe-S cluster assembly iron-binding protein IscA
MVSFTDSAVQRFKDYLDQQNLSDHGVRLFSSAGG